jgi:hypothetical protein
MQGFRSRFVPLSLLALVLWPTLGSSGTAAAQGVPQVAIRLVSQSVWNAVDRPLDLRVSVTNASEIAVDDLTLVLSIQAQVRSRSEYQLSLHEDGTTLFSYPYSQPGIIGPGSTRTFTIRQQLGGLPLFHENGLFPLTVSVVSRGQELAILRTPMIFLTETPQTPLHLTWTWVLSEALQLGPDGVFGPGPMEADIAVGGRLSAMVSAMDAGTPAQLDLAISPVLAEQLDRMAQGYRLREPGGLLRTVPKGEAGAADAARILDSLRRIAGRPRTELIALPFGDARIPALFRSGLGEDLRTLVEAGRDVVTTIIGADPSKAVFRPPQSQIDVGSVDRLGDLGVSLLALDSQSVPAVEGVSPNPPPIVRLAEASRAVHAVVPDREVELVTKAFPDDPRLAAHAALGQLASIWLELPGTPGRGVALLFSEQSNLSPAFFGVMASLVRGSPWLRASTATSMVSWIGQVEQQGLRPATYPGLSPDLVGRITGTRRLLSLFRTIAPDATDLLPRLDTDLLLAEGGTSVTKPTVGMAYVDWVRTQILSIYRKIVPPLGPFTLLSQRGAIPLPIRNRNLFPVHVAVRLVADPRITFPGGNTRTVTVPAGRLIEVPVDVRALTTGRFPVKIQILPPEQCSGCTIAETTVVVRSAAYNRVALVVTIGAAVFLVGWWGRRFLPRRTT